METIELIAQIIVKTLDVSRTGAELPFSDTGSKDALILYDYGIFTGEKDEKGNLLFKPNNNITRAQLARFFYVYVEKNGSEIELKELAKDDVIAVAMDFAAVYTAQNTNLSPSLHFNRHVRVMP